MYPCGSLGPPRPLRKPGHSGNSQDHHPGVAPAARRASGWPGCAPPRLAAPAGAVAPMSSWGRGQSPSVPAKWGGPSNCVPGGRGEPQPGGCWAQGSGTHTLTLLRGLNGNNPTSTQAPRQAAALGPDAQRPRPSSQRRGAETVPGHPSADRAPGAHRWPAQLGGRRRGLAHAASRPAPGAARPAPGPPGPAPGPAAHPEDEIEDEQQVLDALGATLHPHGGAGGLRAGA